MTAERGYGTGTEQPSFRELLDGSRTRTQGILSGFRYFGVILLTFCRCTGNCQASDNEANTVVHRQAVRVIQVSDVSIESGAAEWDYRNK